MTLKEKFEQVETTFENLTGTLKYDELSKAVNHCIKIADDFAIGFAEWLRINYYDNGDYWVEWNNDKETMTSKELLEIYKKENNL